MSRRFIAVFEREEDLLSAVAAYRGLGLTIEDAYTPYAVHGLDEAAGVPRSRLGRVFALLGLSAAALALLFQHWISAVDWPLNVGGKPLSSIPAFIPVTFEVGVLAAGIGTLLAFFIVYRLFPGKRPNLPASGITDDRFVLVLTSGERHPTEADVVAVAEEHNALEARAERESSQLPGRGIDVGDGTFNWGRLNVLLVVVLALLVVANLSLQSRAEHRGVEFLPEMVFPVAAESFASYPSLAGQHSLQEPPTGTIARGTTPFRLEPGEEGSVLAATALVNPLVNPITEGLDEDLTKGGQIFSTYCQLCHGPSGLGDGTVAQRGFPMPPSLLAPHAIDLVDGQIFHLITVGQGNMPGHAGQIDPLDRWRAVLWVRQLQAEAPAAALEPLETEIQPEDPAQFEDPAQVEDQAQFVDQEQSEDAVAAQLPQGEEQ